MALPHDDIEELLEATWSGRDRRFAPRERRIEGGLTALFLIGTCALLTALPAGWRPELVLVPLVLAYAAASLVDYPLGVGYIVPTQPFLVVLFAFVPAPVVPLLIWAALLLERLYQAARGARHPERVLLSGGDAIHALGPALLFVAAGYSWASDAPWELWVAGFAAQLVLDSFSATFREWAVFGVRPQLQLPLLLQVAALDAALFPLGILAAAAASGQPTLAPLALLPLVGLLAVTAHDRAERTSRLSTRFHALERERSRLQVAVKRIGDAFASNLDLDALLEITTRAAVEALNADAGRASGSVGDDGGIRRRIAVTDDEASAALLDRAEALALESGATAATADGESFAVAFALGGGRTPVATIAVARRGAEFADEERDLFQYLCEQAAVAAGNVSRHETLHKQALTDELTGLANHRRLQELLAAATDRYRRTGAPAALVLLDLDHFKLVNDVHGHQIGDKVLHAVGRHLLHNCRVGDEPARYGGEELAVVLEGTALEDATELAERFRRAIAELEVAGPQGEKLRVTVSIGVSILEEGTATSAALIAAADAALYAAKLGGRNRVEVRASSRGRDPQPRPLQAGAPHAVPRDGDHARAELALTLARALDAKQPSTAGHSETVAHFSALIAEGLGLQPSHVYRVWLGGLVHDIGKIAVPDHILNKPAGLTDAEYETIKSHARAGQDMLTSTALAEQAMWVRHHHERFDGTGYPDALAGEAIELEARIIHVADAFEAMTADRPYRRGVSRAEAVQELIDHAGTQFDPACVRVLLDELGLGSVSGPAELEAVARRA